MYGRTWMGIKEGLLAILSHEDAHGYQLKQELEAATGETWHINIGQIYTTLQRLERDGLVDTSDTDEQGRIRYTITPAGRSALGDWMTSPVELAAAGRDEISLKILLAMDLGVGEARRVIEVQRGATMAVLQDYTALKVAEESPDFPWLLHLDRLVFSAEAELRWLELVESRLETIGTDRRVPRPQLASDMEVVR
jgi:DNA-binding PadR family transcriptional regulator